MNIISPTHTIQTGAALIVSLVILVAMTMLGITAMKSSTNELAMVGNLRESALTFQAAEAGLSVAEAQIEAGNLPANMLSQSDTDPDYLDNTTWSGGSINTASVTLENISTALNPLYIVKSLDEWNPDRNVKSVDPGFGGYGQTSTARTVDYYRVTARGFGQTGVTSRTLQSFYGQ
jgi:type IV pilus assembly protein PilX